MAELMKTYTQTLNSARFIGKRYGEEDRINGGFGKQWGDFFQNNWFAALESLCGTPGALCEDDGAYIGLMRYKEGEPFQYWIGMFLPPDTAVPEGFASVDFASGKLGVGWLKGPENELYGQECKVGDRLTEEGYPARNDAEGALWFFERYACPRFTEKDEQGNAILDVCFFI